MIRKPLAKVCGSDTYSTPAPVVSGISISDLTGNMHPRAWDGLVDTAADVTAVPLAACEDLKLLPREKRSPRGFDPKAQRRLLPLYYVGLGVEGIGDLTLLAYGLERSNVLLGRDFLSGLVLLLDNECSRLQVGHHSRWTRLAFRFLALR